MNYNLRICLSLELDVHHKMLKEEGTHHSIAREYILCKYCTRNMVKNGYQVLLVCPFYQDLKRTLLNLFVALITTHNTSSFKTIKYLFN